MPRLAANLTMLFTELPMLDRFAAAAEAGFTGAEILYPYDLSARELYRAAVSAGLDMVLINTPPPNWTGGPRGFAAVPGVEERFRRDFERSLRVAEALRARHIHVVAGRAEGPAARQTFIDNLSWAAERAPHASLTIEPRNTKDNPGYFLNDMALAEEILAAVGAPNIGLQFDAYHAQMITGDMLGAWRQVGPKVRHVQIAGCPGRNEPNLGSMDCGALLRLLDESGYRGWVSAEYSPARQTFHGLGWISHATT